jgi:hypothetical protein
MIHEYFSTACIHEEHDYCIAPKVTREGKWETLGPSYCSIENEPKKPAQCKFCDSYCICGCHIPGGGN